MHASALSWSTITIFVFVAMYVETTLYFVMDDILPINFNWALMMFAIARRLNFLNARFDVLLELGAVDFATISSTGILPDAFIRLVLSFHLAEMAIIQVTFVFVKNVDDEPDELVFIAGCRTIPYKFPFN